MIINLPNKKIYWTIFFSSIVISILSGFYYYNEEPLGDAVYYYNNAKIISTDFWALFTTERIGVMETLNAIFQGIVMLLPGNDFVKVYVLQIVIYSITGIFIFKLSVNFLGRLGALVVLAFYFLQYNHLFHVYSFKPGVWVNFFIIMVIYYAYRVIQKPGERSNYIWVGVLSGLLLLTDLRYLPHLLFMYFIFLFTKFHLSRKLKIIAISAIFLLLTVTPWIIRQSLVFEKFIFISDLNTITIHKAFDTPRFQSLSDYQFLAEFSDEEFNNNFWELRDSLALTPGELIYSRRKAKAQMLNLQEIPIKEKFADLIDKGLYTENEIKTIIDKKENESYIVKRLRRAIYLWQPFSFNYSYEPLSGNKIFRLPASITNNLNRIVTLGILLPFLFTGCILLILRKNLFGILLIGFFLIHTFVHALTYVQWRYLLPILPLVTMVAVYGFKKLIELIKGE